MATMVKEKKREKKKSKEKSAPKSTRIEVPLSDETKLLEESNIVESSKFHVDPSRIEGPSTSEHTLVDQPKYVKITEESINKHIHENITLETSSIKTEVDKSELQTSENTALGIDSKTSYTEYTYKELINRLDRIAIPAATTITEEREKELTASSSYLAQEETERAEDRMEEESQEVFQDVTPSAPCFEEVPEYATNVSYHEEAVRTKPKIACTPIESILKVCGGAEFEEVRLMSDREEAKVEAGPVSGPEHPLVDLLSTFRSSLIAVERERSQLASGYAEEEKTRSTLWKVEKRSIYKSEKCGCGADVVYQATYEHAELAKERLPAARLRLEGLLRDVQESYCHHQHAALLAHCQIEELISETVQSNKNEIREALSLVLQALRVSDAAPAALASALQRWATALAAALLDDRDLRHLLFLLHHLFRQTRSVWWAARVVRVGVDSAGWARVVAVLDLLLAKTRPDTALECTEEGEEVWEEVGRRGGGGGVREGALRERDLLRLLRALPRADLGAKAIFGTTDMRQVRSQEWVCQDGGRGVMRACYMSRVLLGALRRGAAQHAGYERLKAALRALAGRTLHALGCLHTCSRAYYTNDLAERLPAELEAAFAAGFNLFGTHDLDKLPATLLSADTAKDYCVAIMVGLHDKSPKRLDSLGVEVPVLSCEVRVRMVTQAAIDRADDHQLATIVLEFLLQTGIKRAAAQSACECRDAARHCVARLLAAHAYMYAFALHLYGDINQTEALDASSVKALEVDKWRPNSGEVRTLLDDWARRCPQLLQHLLLDLDYTPHLGLALEVQLTIGSWLCGWVKTAPPTPEWAWQVLRKLRPHRASWLLPLDAPPPDEESADLFSVAYALMATSWGHCMPVICSEGVSALCGLAAARPREAAHCLACLMLVMAHSPESIALTPKFTELLTTLLSSGPSLVQRALGRGGASGAELLLRLMLKQLAKDRCGGVSRSAVLSAWLHALWRAALPAAALADTAALATRDWPLLDNHAAQLLLEENAKEHVNYAVRNACTAPLLCECVLRASHAHYEVRTQLHARLLTALHAQRAANQRIHVDNAMQQIGASMSSEELVIYRCASGALAAPAQHPSHLALWRLFMHLYLQRPPEHMSESTPPVGPLFFSGLIKSRTLAQIKRRLKETVIHHQNEAATLKAQTSESKLPQSTNKTKKSQPIVDNSLLPALTIIDLTGESSESSASSDSEESEEDRSEERDNSIDSESTDVKTVENLIAYHTAAAKLCSEYLRWLEEGEQVRAAPHHADIARFIPEHGLEAAWRQALRRARPAACPELDAFPLGGRAQPPPAQPPPAPAQRAVHSLAKIRDRSTRRHRSIVIDSPVEDVDFKDARALLAAVDKHLKDIERLAQEWCNEVSHVSSLDARLWQLVGALRVRRPIPPQQRQCANKCKPITIHIQEQQSCISLDAASGVKENRSGARAAVRRLARPRPHAARTAAALHAIARRVRSSSAGVRVLERAWRSASAPHCAGAAPARAALTGLVELLAERWVCADGALCTELVSRWGGGGGGCSGLQQALCGALVAPRRLPRAAWPPLYAALLAANLPPHATFSYLSKFELGRWSAGADREQRRELLGTLLSAAQRSGAAGGEHGVVAELLGVHAAALLDAAELPDYVLRCARASVTGALPPAHWGHVVRAADDVASQVPFDQLGHLLRECGVVWWEARTGLKGRRGAPYAAYAPHVARLLHALQRAFVGAAVGLSYEPERVAWYAWSALRESWGAWVAPHAAAAPLLPAALAPAPAAASPADDHYTAMLRHFIDNLHQIMLDCPGSEVHLLQQIFEWCVQTHASAHSAAESRAQAAALRAELARLPWSEHHWFYGNCHQIALQVSASPEKELWSWCCATWRHTTAATLLRGTADEQLAPTLAVLLCLFTGTHMPIADQVLEEATLLPWGRLPEPALDEALERFFRMHHNPAQPYHDLPQFRVLLFASEMCVHPEAGAGAQPSSVSRRKRGTCVSQWVRAACAPTLAAHVTAHSTCVLNTITQLAPFLEVQGSEGELEELLSRAVVIMCIEPAAAAALPVWVSWMGGAARAARLARASLSAAAALTVLDYFAPLADAAARAHMRAKESSGWREVCARWSSCAWREPRPLVARGRLHAAYATSLQHATHAQHVRDALHALATANINFVDNEPIVAVWICYLCRVWRECAGAAQESSAAAAALLGKWAEQPRRSILRVVTLHAGTDRPTPLHRVLCRYAQHIVSPSEASGRAYSAACTAAGESTDLAGWAAAPAPARLPRLAARLYPTHDIYFQVELEMAPQETT